MKRGWRTDSREDVIHQTIIDAKEQVVVAGGQRFERTALGRRYRGLQQANARLQRQMSKNYKRMNALLAQAHFGTGKGGSWHGKPCDAKTLVLLGKLSVLERAYLAKVAFVDSEKGLALFEALTREIRLFLSRLE